MASRTEARTCIANEAEDEEEKDGEEREVEPRRFESQAYTVRPDGAERRQTQALKDGGGSLFALKV
ncbi:hypothetical protein JOB18_023717 [Solea senegalensis]|uniref:Uncharacterized protein n=1 Tax=Solea senegalensis TaxID=28829 RepID=A0AAV6RZE1_SOLSE|nr:hypothetical protein JOB18_023717 [Solea senegalensis]